MAFKLPPRIFTPPTQEDLLEFGREMSQDDALSGFQNFGDARNIINLSVTTDQFINAQGGDDFIILRGNTDDTIFGGSGNDEISAGDGDDAISGGSGNDGISGGTGRDTIGGGSGDDTILGDSGDDILSGGSGNDFISGDSNDILASEHGADTLNGGSGNDTLVGGAKADILTGGVGNDTFVFQVGLGQENESKVGEADLITDFQVGHDKIDVSFIDANTNLGGNNLFVFSDAPSIQAGKFWFVTEDDGQHVFFNINGGAADMEIIVHTTSGVLSQSDFLL